MGHGEANQHYENIVSLGYYCGVARDLEKLGLRSFSGPFDWMLSPITGVVAALENSFDGFLSHDGLAQNTKLRQVYRDARYGFLLFHDFDKYKKLDEQLEFVKRKYERRIKRFLSKITKPTMFIRYISTESLGTNDESEIVWVEDNLERILHAIRRFNPNNSILFIADEPIQSATIPLHHAKTGKNGAPSKSPLFASGMHRVLHALDLPEKNENLKWSRKKKMRGVVKRLVVPCKSFFKKLFLKPYQHSKVFD